MYRHRCSSRLRSCASTRTAACFTEAVDVGTQKLARHALAHHRAPQGQYLLPGARPEGDAASDGRRLQWPQGARFVPVTVVAGSATGHGALPARPAALAFWRNAERSTLPTGPVVQPRSRQAPNFRCKAAPRPRRITAKDFQITCIGQRQEPIGRSHAGMNPAIDRTAIHSFSEVAFACLQIVAVPDKMINAHVRKISCKIALIFFHSRWSARVEWSGGATPCRLCGRQSLGSVRKMHGPSSGVAAITPPCHAHARAALIWNVAWRTGFVRFCASARQCFS